MLQVGSPSDRQAFTQYSTLNQRVVILHLCHFPNHFTDERNSSLHQGVHAPLPVETRSHGAAAGFDSF